MIIQTIESAKGKNPSEGGGSEVVEKLILWQGRQIKLIDSKIHEYSMDLPPAQAFLAIAATIAVLVGGVMGSYKIMDSLDHSDSLLARAFAAYGLIPGVLLLACSLFAALTKGPHSQQIEYLESIRMKIRGRKFISYLLKETNLQIEQVTFDRLLNYNECYKRERQEYYDAKEYDEDDAIVDCQCNFEGIVRDVAESF